MCVDLALFNSSVSLDSLSIGFRCVVHNRRCDGHFEWYLNEIALRQKLYGFLSEDAWHERCGVGLIYTERVYDVDYPSVTQTRGGTT